MNKKESLQEQESDCRKNEQAAKMPFIKSDMTPHDVIVNIFGVLYKENKEYLAMLDCILAFYIVKNSNWEDYRKKVPPNILSLWNRVLTECYRQGYIFCGITGDEMTWFRIMTNKNKSNDLCSLCERPCVRRYKIDSGEQKRLYHEFGIREKNPCWHNGNEDE